MNGRQAGSPVKPAQPFVRYQDGCVLGTLLVLCKLDKTKELKP